MTEPSSKAIDRLVETENGNQFVRPLACWIKLIRDLPDHILETEHGVRIPFGKKNKVELIMYGIRAKYRAIADWLQYYLLDDQGILTELTLLKKSHYKPVAEIVTARYKLAQELQFHLPVLVDSFDRDNNPFNPGRWMTFCVHQACKHDLKKSGLLDLATTEGKSAQHLRVQKNLKWLEEDAISRSDEFKIRATTLEDVKPINFLEGCSLHVAKIDPGFREDYHNVYIETLRRCYRKIRNNPFFRVITLDEKGELVTKAKGKGKSKKTGFGKER